MRTLYLDIETVPDPDYAHTLALDEMAAAREEESERFASLCPPLASVASVAMLAEEKWLVGICGNGSVAAQDVGEAAPTLPSRAAAHDLEGSVQFFSEAELIEKTIRAIERVDRVVTYYGRRFDIPVLMMRAMKHRLPCEGLAVLSREYRYKPVKHWDLADWLTGFGAAPPIALRAMVLGILGWDVKALASGAEVSALVASRSWAALAAYNLGDVVALRDLHARARELGVMA